MSNELMTAMTSPVNRAGPLAMLPEESAGRNKFVAASVIKAKRGNRSQIEIARAAGISQAFISELENGRKRLTLRTAQKLAPVLETTADHLMLAEHLAKLSRAAQKGRIDLQPLLVEVQRLAEILPGGEVGDAIVEALVGLVRGGFKIGTLRRVRKSDVDDYIEFRLVAKA